MARTAVGRITRRSTFRALRRPEGRASRGPVRVAYVTNAQVNGTEGVRVGYAVSRRCGNAVTRNRLRRRLRAAAASVAADGLPAGSYLVTPGPDARDLTHPELVATVGEALRGAAGSRP